VDRAVAAGDVRIQVERTEDRDAVAAVVAAAFGSRAEADLVEAIRSSPEYIAELSLVAEGDGGIVGHVMVSHAELHRGDVRHLIFSLAPLAVTPSRQGQGIGSALGEGGHRRGAEDGSGFRRAPGTHASTDDLVSSPALPWGSPWSFRRGRRLRPSRS